MNEKDLSRRVFIQRSITAGIALSNLSPFFAIGSAME